MISYKPLHRLLRDRGMGWEELRIEMGFSSATLAKLRRNVPVSLETIDRICRHLQCRIEDVLLYED